MHQNTINNNNATDSTTTTKRPQIMDPSLFFSPVPGNYQKENDNNARQSPLRKRAYAIDIALSDITNDNFRTDAECSLALAALTNHYQLDDRNLPLRTSNRRLS
mmetsp:Transcript_20068/g.29778  ORF Transcript_20068/g.29778 Transcript_20068/m.29778 type:complete len:104 (+) Transcript_20068:49-360(+)